MYKILLSTLFLGFSAPFLSLAMPTNLACKVSGPHGSAQMSSTTIQDVSQDKTFLNFDRPVTWSPDVTSFELVYSSGYDPRKDLVLVANAVSAHDYPQMVEIKLAAPSAGMPTTRYGTVQAGDFRSSWSGSFGKSRQYEIQCFNF